MTSALKSFQTYMDAHMWSKQVKHILTLVHEKIMSSLRKLPKIKRHVCRGSKMESKNLRGIDRKVRRQCFQFRQGGFSTFIHKFSTVRAVITRVSSLYFSNTRLWLEMAKIAPNFTKSFTRFPLSGEGKNSLNSSVGKVLALSQFHRDAQETDKALEVLEVGVKSFPKSIDLRKSAAQLHFVRGEWSKYLLHSIETDQLMEQIAKEQSLDETGLRFLGSDWTGPLGHISMLDAVIKLRELNLLSDEKRVLLYDRRYVANDALLKLFVPRIPSINSNRLVIDAFVKKFGAVVDQVPMFRLKSGVVDQWSAIDVANQEWSRRNRDPLIKLPEEIGIKGTEILARWGIPADEWFVLVHVREGSHRSQARLQNADIASYLPMIREIVRRGGWAVRMGSPSMTSLPAMPGVIDYAHAVERVAWMDVFLWAKARFSIATNSGGSEVPMCFGIPAIRTNYSSFGHCSYFEKSFMVPKRYKLKGDRSTMSLAQTLTTPIPWCESTVHENIQFEVVDNSPQDLVNAVVEMFTRLESDSWDLSKEQTRAQDIRRAGGAVGNLPIAKSFLENHPSFSTI